MPKYIVKEIDKKRSIGQVARELGVQTHVIRFWETKFEQIQPAIGKGDRRYYFENDINILKKIKHYLYEEGYTILGLNKLLSSKSMKMNKKDGDSNSVNDNSSAGGLSKKQKKELENLIDGVELKLGQLQELIG